jgi:hypothetical protein
MRQSTESCFISATRSSPTQSSHSALTFGHLLEQPPLACERRVDPHRAQYRPKCRLIGGPILKFSETQPRWTLPTPQLGGDAPEWLDARPQAAAAE